VTEIKRERTFFLSYGDAKMTLDSPMLGESRSAVGSDLYLCFQRLRSKLEVDDVFPLCYGARVECWASDVSRDTGWGRSVYVLEMGKEASTSDLVDLFDPASRDSVGSVAEQERFHREWEQSLSS
jgi:hypothetical protein